MAGSSDENMPSTENAVNDLSPTQQPVDGELAQEMANLHVELQSLKEKVDGSEGKLKILLFDQNVSIKNALKEIKEHVEKSIKERQNIEEFTAQMVDAAKRTEEDAQRNSKMASETNDELKKWQNECVQKLSAMTNEMEDENKFNQLDEKVTHLMSEGIESGYWKPANI